MGYLTPTDAPVSDDWHKHKERESHEPGTDYACAYGTNLRAPAAGIILRVDRDPGGPAGRRLTLLLDDGRAVDWIHLDSIQANAGQRFNAGQTGLALSGASADGDDWGTDGPHVHVTLRADRWRQLADTLNFEDYTRSDSGLTPPPYPLPWGYYFGPEGGPETSVSGWHSHREDLRAWQQRMADRGWNITPDGLYGPEGATEPTGETATIAHAFQVEKGLDTDSLIGPATWNAAWTEPVT